MPLWCFAKIRIKQATDFSNQFGPTLKFANQGQVDLTYNIIHLYQTINNVKKEIAETRSCSPRLMNVYLYPSLKGNQ